MEDSSFGFFLYFHQLFWPLWTEFDNDEQLKSNRNCKATDDEFHSYSLCEMYAKDETQHERKIESNKYYYNYNVKQQRATTTTVTIALKRNKNIQQHETNEATRKKMNKNKQKKKKCLNLFI